MRFLLANPPHALLRRLLALAVVLLPVPGGAFSLMVPASVEHCGERVCKCAHHCAPRKAAERAQKPAPCHEEPAPAARSFFEPGPCGAGRATAEAPPPVRPHLAEGRFDFTPLGRATAPEPAERLDPSSGFLDTLLQPPRTNA